MELAGSAALLLAVPAVALLGNSGRRHTGAARRAHLLLAYGGAVVTGAALAGLLTAMLTQAAPPRLALGSTIALALTIGMLILLTGTMALPGAAASPGAAVRQLLDALIIAAGLWFAGWVLLSAPIRLFGAATPVARLPLLLPAGFTAISVGLTIVLALHAHRPRLITVRVAVGVSLVAIATTALAGGICQGWSQVLLAGTVALPTGLFVVARAVKVADRPVEPIGDVIDRGTAYVIVPMVATIAALGYHLAAGGIFGLFGYLGVAVECGALVARQFLALRDVQRYTGRLLQREAHFRDLAHTDPLTELANRRGLQRALRAAAEARVLVGIDLDGFKNVNDMRGHDVGDAVLIEVADRLRGNLLADDVAAIARGGRSAGSGRHRLRRVQERKRHARPRCR